MVKTNHQQIVSVRQQDKNNHADTETMCVVCQMSKRMFTRQSGTLSNRGFDCCFQAAVRYVHSTMAKPSLEPAYEPVLQELGTSPG